MEVLYKDNLKQAIASSELRERVIGMFPKADWWLSVAYTDYGGTILDRAYIEAVEAAGFGDLVEGAAYFGKNALIPITEKEANEFYEYPIIELSLLKINEAKIEDKINEVELTLVNEAVEQLKNNYKIEDEEKLRDYLLGSRIEPNYVDYNEDDLIKQGLIKPCLIKKVVEW